MRSESTVALGQPSETQPTRGARAGAGRARMGDAVSMGTARVSDPKRHPTNSAAPPPRLARTPRPLAFPGLLRFLRTALLGRAARGGRAGRVRAEREVLEHVAGLRLHLLLHLHEQVLALLEAVAPHRLHHGRLQRQELRPYRP